MAALVVFLSFSVCGQDAPTENLSSLPLRILVTQGQECITIHSAESVECRHGEGTLTLPAGTWAFSVARPRAAIQHFHVFTKTFQMSEASAARAYVAQWKRKKYAARLVTMGRQVRTPTGQVLDNRIYWVSVARTDTLKGAEALKTRLEEEGQWAWIRPETVKEGAGQLTLTDGRGQRHGMVSVPLTLAGASSIEVAEIDSGFWKKEQAHRSYSGTLRLGVGPDAKLSVTETVGLADYLKGVVVAEMPHGWPLEALKAQAVAARSEALASLGHKHDMEGADFCGSEHCRAYRGHGGREESTDRAVEATRGEVLLHGGAVVETVFSSSCGGATENNDNVWSGPAQPCLRGVRDASKRRGSRGPDEKGLRKWILTSPPAYCSIDKRHYRWRKDFTVEQLTELVNRRHEVGQVKALELGGRGFSGRLKWMRIVGAKRSVTVRKELAIRQVLGGLPSAMFIVDVEPDEGAARRFTLHGGGRGHGVGMCQHGARGMALQGLKYEDILMHYFSDATVAGLPAKRKRGKS